MTTDLATASVHRLVAMSVCHLLPQIAWLEHRRNKSDWGLQDKATDQFLAVVARFPDNVEARQELRDVFKDKGDKDKAAEQSRALAEICRLKGDAAGAKQHEAESTGTRPTSPSS